MIFLQALTALITMPFLTVISTCLNESSRMIFDEPHYPDWLEEWWLDQVAVHTPQNQDDHDLDALAEEVQALSDLFIRDEANFAAYDKDPRQLLAYGLFFFPQTYVRVQWPLRELLAFRGWQPPLERPMRILDLGSGLGSASLGALDVLYQYTASLDLPERPEFHLTAVDHATHSLQWYNKLVQDLQEVWPRLTLRTRVDNLLRYGTLPPNWNPASSVPSEKKPRQGKHHQKDHRKDRRKGESQRDKRRPSRASTRSHNDVPPPAPQEEPWDLIVSSFALTEVFRGHSSEVMWTWIKGLLDRLSPDGILLILEPASQDSCERLEDLRNFTAQDEAYGIWGPCLHHQTCPLRQEGRAWCHEVRFWETPESLEYVNRRLFRALQALKFGYLALGHKRPKPKPPTNPTMRLIAPMSKQKGHWLTRGCTTEGQSINLEIFTRDLDREQAQEIEQFHRGDIVEASNWEPRKRPQSYRLSPGARLAARHPEDHTLELEPSK